MSERLFDGYLMVDWSAAATSRTGADSVWIAHLPPNRPLALENPPTRVEAMARISEILSSAEGRYLAGFDFPFGYPEGTTEKLTGSSDWRALWALLAELVSEGPKNTNNRFDVAAALNSKISVQGPFYGNGLRRDIEHLPRKKPEGYGDSLPPRYRYAESRTKGAQEVWKLVGAGSVGGQALTGIAALEMLRQSVEVDIWPFETLGEGRAHVLAEIYPSLIPPHPSETVKDAGQVRSVVEAVAAHDRIGRLAGFLEAPRAMPAAVRREEACILGMDAPAIFATGLVSTSPPKPHLRPLRYERDPAAIYAASFATVRREARLERFSPAMERVAIRLIHACGMVEVADRLAFSPGAAEAGAEALANGAPILCDCEMVGAGIIRRNLPAANDVIVTLNDPAVPGLAAEIGNTRSAAAVRLWEKNIEGAVVAIGNAPTALFHLLELLDQGWPRPAVILGFPVGFVGAAESKAELAARPRGAEFIALRGRRGGSAIASAAVNALAAGLPEEDA